MEDLHGLDGWSKNKVEKYGREVTQVVCRVLQKYDGIRPKANNNSHAATAAKRKGNFSSSNNNNSNQPQWQNKRQSLDSYSYEY